MEVISIDGLVQVSGLPGPAHGGHGLHQHFGHQVSSPTTLEPVIADINVNVLFQLLQRWADITKSIGRDGTERQFDHPFLQAVAMFIGELSCLLAYKLLYHYYKKKDYTDDQLPPSISGSRSFNPLIFLPPAICDMLATSLMYIGLNLTYASSFQMLRGALIIFTGLLSVAFLNRRLKCYEWMGILCVMLGLSIVGTSDIIFGSDSASGKGTASVVTGEH